MAEGFGTCTWPYAIVDGVRTHISDAARLQHGECPVCGAELVARKGKFREDHWWHVNGKRCDPWYQPKGPWHLYWQNMFPKECQEVVVEGDVDGTRVRHIADVKTHGGIVLEVQYSAISPETIAIREDFYGNMLWLANMRRIESDTKSSRRMSRRQRVSMRTSPRRLIMRSCGSLKARLWRRPTTLFAAKDKKRVSSFATSEG